MGLQWMQSIRGKWSYIEPTAKTGRGKLGESIQIINVFDYDNYCGFGKSGSGDVTDLRGGLDTPQPITVRACVSHHDYSSPAPYKATGWQLRSQLRQSAHPLIHTALPRYTDPRFRD